MPLDNIFNRGKVGYPRIFPGIHFSFIVDGPENGITTEVPASLNSLPSSEGVLNMVSRGVNELMRGGKGWSSFSRLGCLRMYHFLYLFSKLLTLPILRSSESAPPDHAHLFSRVSGPPDKFFRSYQSTYGFYWEE